MHGRGGEHMLPVTTSSSVPVAALISTSDSFLKDGRKIHVGDCALFKPPQDSPPFVGIIRKLIIGKEESLSLRVNWLYRPADVKLGKGVVLEAAPNEVFYSFHKDEIPAASLLHPCKVAFLRKGVELPSGISSFVCRRVYDIENKCLWWLTDQDYINERQEEVDQLLEKTRLEMYGAVQSGGRSPKPLNGSLKPGSDSVQNSSSPFHSQVKGKKRELGGQGSDPVKRERTEHMLKSEIAKITDKSGLVDFEGVEKLVQLMQPDGTDKKLDLAFRIMLVDVISVTERFDCLGRFVQLRGLPVLDEWLQEVHKGKIGDGGTSPKESDKSVDEFLLALLRALDKLPVNLHALQTCNVGKSVNNLRTHKNPEIQKKARGLVDTWKKRVEAEMNMIDAKSGSSRGGWPNKSVISEVSHMGSRRIGGSSDVGAKGSVIQSCATKTPPTKLGSGDASKFSAVSSDLPLTTIKEEKSSSSSQSQNNSQSCSSDHGKTGISCREDARSSTAGSMSVNKILRSRKSSNGLHGSAGTGVQKESFGKVSSLNRNFASEKASPTRVTSERIPDVSDNGNSQRLIVRLPNTGRSPARSVSGGSPEKFDHHDRKIKGKSDALRVNGASNVNVDMCAGKDGLTGSDEVGLLSDERSRDGEVGEKLTDASKVTCSSSTITASPGKKSYEASFSSINALVESCVKFSEASASASVGDDIGMNLLASVAAGEISRSDVSPLSSPVTKSPVREDSCSGNDAKSRQTDEDRTESKSQPDEGTNGAATLEKGRNAQSNSSKGRNAQSNSSSMDLAQNGNGSFSSSEGNAPEIIQDPCAAKASASPGEEGITEGEGADQFHESRKSVISPTRSNQALNSKLKATSPSADEDTGVGCADEKAVENCVEVVPEADDSRAKVKTETNEESTSCPTSDLHGEDEKLVHKELGGNILAEQKATHVVRGKSQDTPPANGSHNDLGVESKAERVDDMKPDIQTEQSENTNLGSSIMDHNSEISPEYVEKKEVLGHHPGGLASHKESPRSQVQETEQSMKSSGCKSDGAVKPASDMTVKLDFDLNEGLPVDDGSTGELVKSIHLPGQFPSSITVAAPAKGPFVPPENPLKSKGELGWKGSAATSAFRPAEPRKVIETPLSTTAISHVDDSSIKRGRPLFDFDLNVPDDRALEDNSQNPAPVTCSMPGTRDRTGGGLNLDLNSCDESPEIGPFSVSNGSRFEIPKMPGRSPLSVGFSNSDLNAISSRGGFDLNNGPGPDESSSETPSHVKSGMPFLASVPGVRMSNMELGHFSSFFSPGNYSAIAIPPILPSRGEQNYPVVPAGGSQRMMGPITGNTSFGPEIYRGAVLSSSPAITFPPNTPFQYPGGFPFETSFPLSSNSYSGVSPVYVDSSSGGPICFPAMPSQLVGPTGVVSTHYPRPYGMGLPGGTSSVGPEARKWGNQSLDLNTGPGGTDVERRDERLSSSLRQLPVGGVQGLTEEQLKMYQMAGGGILKRKEPDGGWDGGDRINYKHPSWQ